MTEKDTIIVGKITAVHGVRGAVLVCSYTQVPNSLFDLPLVTRDGAEMKLQLLHQKAPGRYICKLNGVDNRNDAEKFLKWYLYCHKSTMPSVAEDEFYIADLIGIEVRNPANEAIGRVIYIHNFGADDLVEVQIEADKSKIMVPFTKEFVPEVQREYIICEIDKLNEN